MATSTNNPGGTTGGGSLIPESTAQLLIETYKTEDGWGPDETRAVWFSVQDFTNIISLVNDYGGDGARIYFGKYPSDTDIPGTPDPSYKGMVTLVFIPTLAGPGGSHQDVFPATPTSSFVAAARTNGGNMGYDHGELCPPC